MVQGLGQSPLVLERVLRVVQVVRGDSCETRFAILPSRRDNYALCWAILEIMFVHTVFSAKPQGTCSSECLHSYAQHSSVQEMVRYRKEVGTIST